MNHYEPTAEQLDEWAAWLSDRPQAIKDLGARFPPWKLYRIKSTGHRVVPHSFNEDGTLTVSVLGTFNAVAFERNVFGILPDDLEECDLPAADERLGVASREIANITGRDEEEVIDEIVEQWRQQP